MADQIQEEEAQTLGEESTSSNQESQELSAEPSIEMSVEVEADLRRKATEEGYQLTDEELDSIEKWEEEGRPEPVKKEDKPEEDQDSVKKDDESDPSTSTEEEDKKGDEEEKQEGTLEEAFNLVGAKSQEELAGKIKGFQKYYNDKASQQGTEIRELTTKNEELQSHVTAANELLDGAKRGDPSTVAWFKEHIPELFQANGVKDEIQVPEDIIDPETYRKTVEIQRALDELRRGGAAPAAPATQAAPAAEPTQQQADTEQLKTYSMSKVTELIRENPDLVPEGSNPEALVYGYYNRVGDAGIDPKFQRVHDILALSVNKGIGFENLKLAKYAYDMENGVMEQAKIDAAREARENLKNQEPSRGLSTIRSQGGGSESIEQYTEADVIAMANRQKPIPDEWFNDDGDLKDYSELPEVAGKVIESMRRSSLPVYR